MENTNNILTGLKVTSQIPLDSKRYSIDEATLQDLGLSDNLAYTYHKGLIVTCITERTQYEWREMENGLVGLLTTDFTYPNGLIVNGIDYSNKNYNFVKIEQVADIVFPPPTNQDNFVRQLFISIYDIPFPNYTKQDICDYILGLPEAERTLLETDSKWNIILFDSPS